MVFSLDGVMVMVGLLDEVYFVLGMGLFIMKCCLLVGLLIGGIKEI